MATESDLDYQGDNSAHSMLKWAIDKYYPRIGLACSFQTTVLVHMALEINRDVPIFALDTGRLNEETYACANEVERRFGIRIRWYFPRHDPVQKLVREKGLYSFRESVENRRECCQIRKVEPLNRALSEVDCWITGLRRDQSISRAEVKPIALDHSHGDIVKVSPIIDWSISDVNEYVKQHKLPYNALMERGYKSVGCAPCTRAVHDGEHPRAGRWWWELDEHKECGLHVRNWNI